MTLLKTISLAIFGCLAGWVVRDNWPQTKQIDLALVTKICPDFAVKAKEIDATAMANLSANSQADCPIVSQPVVTGKRGIDDLILNLVKNRNILPDELSILSRWNSFEDFEDYIDQIDLNNGDQHHLHAKAEVYFRKNYISALEELYSAQQASIDLQNSDAIQGEINVLIEYVRANFFSENSFIPERIFTEFMNRAYEKQPDYMPVIVALIKHHLLIGEFTIVKNFIDAIPMDPDKLHTIEMLRSKLEQTIHSKENVKRNTEEPVESVTEEYVENGIPMEKHGNHFMVKVTVNEDIVLNLLLDTGASRTAVSNKTMQSMLSISNQIKDLHMSQQVNTANGISRVSLFQAKEISVGGFSLSDPLIFTANLGNDSKIHGLLGMDFLGQFQFRIDHQKNLLYLSH